MGCGSSQETNQPEEKQERPVQQQQQQKQQPKQSQKSQPKQAPQQSEPTKIEEEQIQEIEVQEQSPYPENYGVLHIQSGRGKIVDLSNRFLQEPVTVVNDIYKYYDSSCFNIDNFKSKIQECEKIVIIADVDSKEGLEFLGKQLPKLELPAEKLHIMIICSTAHYQEHYQGTASETYKLDIVEKNIPQESQVTFIDRYYWYSTPSKQDIILEILKKNETLGFYPRGVETREGIIQMLHQTNQNLWTKRMFCMYMMQDGFSELDIINGFDNWLKRFQNTEELQLYDELKRTSNVQMFPNQIRSQKIIVPMGSQAQQLSANFSNYTVSEFSEIIAEGYDCQNKEFIFIIDPSEKVDQKFMSCEFKGEALEKSTFISVFLVPQDPSLLYFPLSASVENCQLNILLQQENNDSNLQFISALLEVQGSWATIYQQLCPFPRLSIMVPCINGESIFSSFENPITEPHSVMTVVSINKGIEIEDDNAIGGYGIRNRQKLVKSGFEGNFQLVGNYKSVQKYLEQLIQNEEIVDKVGELYQYEDKEQYNMHKSNIEDLASEFQYYSTPEEQECAEG